MAISYQWLSEWLEEGKQSVGPFYEEAIKKSVKSIFFVFIKYTLNQTKSDVARFCSQQLKLVCVRDSLLPLDYSHRLCYLLLLLFLLLLTLLLAVSTFWGLKQLKNISTAVHYASLQSKHVYFSLLRQNDPHSELKQSPSFAYCLVALLRCLH